MCITYTVEATPASNPRPMLRRNVGRRKVRMSSSAYHGYRYTVIWGSQPAMACPNRLGANVKIAPPTTAAQ